MTKVPAGPALIDTSLWIEALDRSGAPEARSIVRAVVEPGLALVNGLIMAELLRGARDASDFGRLQLFVEATTSLALDKPTWERAAHLGYDLRRAGVTVPTADLVIAASAMEAGVTLLHMDVHFELIAAHAPLQQQFVRAG